MALFVQICEGRSAADAQPVVASSDPEVVRAVMRALERRFDPDRRPTPIRPRRPREVKAEP